MGPGMDEMVAVLDWLWDQGASIKQSMFRKVRRSAVLEVACV